MSLADYLREEKRSQVEFARRVGLSASYLNEIVRGVKTPALKVAIDIERETDGKVSIASLLVTEKGAVTSETEQKGAA